MIGVVVVFSLLAQCIGKAYQLSFGCIGEFGFVTGTVGNEVGLAVFIVVIGGTVAIRFGHRQQQTVVGIVEMQDKAVRTGNTLTESYFIWI